MYKIIKSIDENGNEVYLVFNNINKRLVGTYATYAEARDSILGK
jgi:hypothetical protein